MYGLAAAEAADLAKEGVVTIIEIVDSTAYDVRFKLNDDDQCLNIYIYINGKLTGAKAYRHLINLSEDEVVTELSKAATNAIIAYRIR